MKSKKELRTTIKKYRQERKCLLGIHEKPKKINKQISLHHVWHNMIYRCTKENHASYKNYGGRGIKVCKEWINDRENFYNWAYTNGYKKGLQIDRVNNNGDYEPTNCRFTTRTKNIRNSRTPKLSCEIVAEIRTQYKENSNRECINRMAKLYSVHFSTIVSAIKYKTWKNILL